jgi:outer membrane protein OmpA-like peptidoglycan-associated protein
MQTEEAPMQAAAPAVPRRAVIGAGLVALAIGLAAWAGLSGAALAPASTDYQFSRGTQLATGEEARMKADIARAAADDRLHLRVIGHSGTEGDAAANMRLSEDRAEAARGIALAAGLPASRIDWVGGVGGGDPLPRGDDMGDRAYQSGLARVTLIWRLQP